MVRPALGGPTALLGGPPILRASARVRRLRLRVAAAVDACFASSGAGGSAMSLFVASGPPSAGLQRIGPVADQHTHAHFAGRGG